MIAASVLLCYIYDTCAFMDLQGFGKRVIAFRCIYRTLHFRNMLSRLPFTRAVGELASALPSAVLSHFFVAMMWT